MGKCEQNQYGISGDSEDILNDIGNVIDLLVDDICMDLDFDDLLMEDDILLF